MKTYGLAARKIAQLLQQFQKRGGHVNSGVVALHTLHSTMLFGG